MLSNNLVASTQSRFVHPVGASAIGTTATRSGHHIPGNERRSSWFADGALHPVAPIKVLPVMGLFGVPLPGHSSIGSTVPPHRDCLRRGPGPRLLSAGTAFYRWVHPPAANGVISLPLMDLLCAILLLLDPRWRRTTAKISAEGEHLFSAGIRPRPALHEVETVSDYYLSNGVCGYHLLGQEAVWGHQWMRTSRHQVEWRPCL